MKKLTPFFLIFAFLTFMIPSSEAVAAKFPITAVADIESSPRLSSYEYANNRRLPAPLRINHIRTVSEFVQAIEKAAASSSLSEILAAYVRACEEVARQYGNGSRLPNGARLEKLSKSYLSLGKQLSELSEVLCKKSALTPHEKDSVKAIGKNIQEIFKDISIQSSVSYLSFGSQLGELGEVLCTKDTLTPGDEVLVKAIGGNLQKTYDEIRLLSSVLLPK